jgi:hypothetical protein
MTPQLEDRRAGVAHRSIDLAPKAAQLGCDVGLTGGCVGGQRLELGGERRQALEQRVVNLRLRRVRSAMTSA